MPQIVPENYHAIGLRVKGGEDGGWQIERTVGLGWDRMEVKGWERNGVG